jgi:hypothetical protein
MNLYLQLLLTNKIQTRGVLRPIIPQVYTPGVQVTAYFVLIGCSICQNIAIFMNAYLSVVVFAALDIIQAYGIKLIEKNE